MVHLEHITRPGDLEADAVVPPQWPTKSSLAGFLWEPKTCVTNLLLQDCGFRTEGQSWGVWGSGQCWETRTLVPVSWCCLRLSAAGGHVIGLMEECSSLCLLRGLLGGYISSGTPRAQGVCSELEASCVPRF